MPSWLVRNLRQMEELTAELEDDILTVSTSGGNPVTFVVEARGRMSLEGARTLVPDAQARSSNTLVATRRLTNEAREVLKTNGISWVERDTNACWIKGPGILITRSPDPTLSDEEPSDGLSRPTTLQKKSGVIAETILLFYRDDHITVRDVANKAGTAVGLVSQVLQRLELEDVVAATGLHAHKKRRLIDSARLLDLWKEEEQVDGWSRHGLYVWSQTTRKLHSRLRELNGTGLRWALGHSSAAHRYMPTLTREPDPEIWIPAEVPAEQVAKILDGELVDSGANLAVWQSPGDHALHHAGNPDSTGGSHLPMVSRYRAYLEAYHRGGRIQEVATRLREGFDLSESSPTS